MAVATMLEELLDGEVVDSNDIARAIGATPRSLSRWATSKSAPRKESEERLLELKAVVDLLRGVVRDEPARLWLRSPNPDLTGRTPLEVVANGEYRRVVAAVLAMAEGVTS